MKEIEARFLEIEPKEIESKLKKLGAKKVSDKTFKEAIFLPPTGLEFDKWMKNYARIRIRDTGTEVFLTFKENKKFGLSQTKEVEMQVSSFETCKIFLESIGLKLYRYQEKRRISYVSSGVKLEIDFWPWIPPCFEIEGENEKKVKEWAKKLDLDWNTAEFRDAAKVYHEVYGIDLLKVQNVSFGLPKPDSN